jgi:hypothetical protein
LGQKYQKLCDRKPDFYVMVDGIAKPIIGSYQKSLIAEMCANYYQVNSTVHGGEISGCTNVQLLPKGSGGTARDHIDIEWKGTARGKLLILSFLNKSGDQFQVTLKNEKELDQSQNK